MARVATLKSGFSWFSDWIPKVQNEVAIPPELGYGSAGFGSIPGHATLYLELELLRAAPFAPTAEQARWLREYPEGEASGG